MKLSPAYEKILKTGSTNEQGWFAVQTLLLRADEKDSDPVISEFLDQVDDSNYSLTDWLEALLRFDVWLEAQKIESRPLASMIGYIHCCTMTSAETLAPPELARLVEENLEQWGFEAAVGVG